LFWYAYGEIYRVQERFDEALSAYKKAVEIDPPYPKALQKLGMLLSDRKQYDEAEVVLTQAIRREPKAAPAYFTLAVVYHSKKKYKLALENYQKFLELAPKNDPDRDRAASAIKDLKRAK
jgi:cytochrome c-type biogenesis protein CcmH/NrfG